MGELLNTWSLGERRPIITFILAGQAEMQLRCRCDASGRSVVFLDTQSISVLLLIQGHQRYTGE